MPRQFQQVDGFWRVKNQEGLYAFRSKYHLKNPNGHIALSLDFVVLLSTYSLL